MLRIKELQNQLADAHYRLNVIILNILLYKFIILKLIYTSYIYIYIYVNYRHTEYNYIFSQELANENKLLKALQKRQDSALKRYEGTNAELPRIINSHHEELRVLQIKYKKLKTLQKETCDLLKEKENELQQLQVNINMYNIFKQRIKKINSCTLFLSHKINIYYNSVKIVIWEREKSYN